MLSLGSIVLIIIPDGPNELALSGAFSGIQGAMNNWVWMFLLFKIPDSRAVKRSFMVAVVTALVYIGAFFFGTEKHCIFCALFLPAKYAFVLYLIFAVFQFMVLCMVSSDARGISARPALRTYLLFTVPIYFLSTLGTFLRVIHNDLGRLFSYQPPYVGLCFI